MGMKDKIWTGLVLIIAVVFVGILVFSINTPNNQEFVPGIGGGPGDANSPTRPSRATLQILLTHHGVLASNHLSTLYDNKDTYETAASLEDNSQKIADNMADIGANREQFLTMWKGHIRSYEDYTQAVKNNNRSLTTQVRANLSSQAMEMGLILNQILPSISAEEVTKLMEEHINLTLSIAEAHAKADLTNKVALMTNASTQAVRFANTLYDAIENSQPQ